MKQIKHFSTSTIFKIFKWKDILFGNIIKRSKMSISCSDCIIDGFEYFCRTRNCITSAGNSKIMPLTTSNKFQAMVWLTRKLNYINK